MNDYQYEDRPDKIFERLLDLVEADVLVCGHTPLPFHKVLPSGRPVVNVGSVGKLKDNNPKSCHIDLRAEGYLLSVNFPRVAYDVEKTARMIEAIELPDEFAKMLRDASG